MQSSLLRRVLVWVAWTMFYILLGAQFGFWGGLFLAAYVFLVIFLWRFGVELWKSRNPE